MMELFQAAAARLLSWPRVMLLSHDRPDGDALGSMAGMCAVLDAIGGRQAVPFVYGPIPARYAFLQHGCRYTVLPTDTAGLEAQFDGILIVDTCSWAQLEPVANFLRGTRLPKLIVDHHATRDVLSEAGSDDLYVIDPTAASCCGILFDWCAAMGWPIPPAAAEALFTGIATDTGWFRFSNTDPRTLRAAAALVELGVRPDCMYGRAMESYSLARLRLKTAVLDTLELHAGGTLACMRMTAEMLQAAGATAADAEDLVNEPLSSREVLASILLGDLADGRIRVNLRSKSPEVTGINVDVSAVAAQLGGGGHQRAAGARVTGTMAQVYPVVLEHMLAAIRTAQATPSQCPS